MKSKESPNLYEILRNASRPPGEPAAAPGGSTPVAEAPAGPTLQDRLAAYKAAKLSLGTPEATAPLKPAPATLPEAPGERIVRLTYNTAAFVGLVILGMVFIAYSMGVRSGRAEALVVSKAPEAVFRPAEPVPPPPVAPPPAPKVYGIRLIEWPGRTATERGQAMAAADRLIRALNGAGHRGAETITIQRGAETRVALYIGKFPDRSAAAAKQKLAEVRRMTVQNQPVFAGAEFEELPK